MADNKPGLPVMARSEAFLQFRAAFKRVALGLDAALGAPYGPGFANRCPPSNPCARRPCVAAFADASRPAEMRSSFFGYLLFVPRRWQNSVYEDGSLVLEAGNDGP